MATGNEPAAVDEQRSVDAEGVSTVKQSLFMRVYTNAWFQVLLISFICFCCPGVS